MLSFIFYPSSNWKEESYLDRLSNSAQDLWNTKLSWIRLLDLILEEQKIPVFIANPICNDYVWQLSHHSLGSRVHEIESTSIIGLLERVFVRESISL
jgi:hypothetical protein